MAPRRDEHANEKIKFLGVIFLAMARPMMAADSAKLAVPSRAQVEWQNAGIGIFVHWAPNVYQGTEGDEAKGA